MNSEKENKSEIETIKEEQQKPNRKIQKRIISFDVYFQILMSKNKHIFSHHKAAMKKYAEQKGCLEATEEEFERIMRLY